ncbi:YbbR-like domain-containing protein [Paenibacillus sp. SGZ-1009]|uniref:CdaR family protein n=1 Tax=Paenibacillus campi TaxID=3106031 RepID=UPI002AFF94FA|nr:CdaR family protein [Paenibacillus sp. SGZ-1009]
MMDKWISNNTVAKILALVVSILLWVMVHMDNNTIPTSTTSAAMGTSVINNVEVQPYGFDEDKYVLKSIEPATVNIEVRGQSDLISYFSTSSYKAKVNLSDIKGAGTVTLPIVAETPASVQYVSSTPGFVKVTIEEKTSNSFIPQIQVEGEPAAGYQKGDPVIVDGPDKVSVTLPESRLRDVGSVQGVINIAGATDTVNKTVTLAVYDKSGAAMKDAVVSPATVKVQVPIGKASRTLPLTLSYIGQLPDNLVLANTEVSADEVTVYGSQSELAALGSSITASVNLSSINQAGTVTLTAALDLPEDTDRISPSSVQVKITTEKFSERTVQNVPVRLTGIGNNLEATITDPQSQQVAISIKGAPDAIQAVKPEDIKATVNLSGRVVGTYKLPVQIVLPETVSLSNPGEQMNVTVTVTESSGSTTPSNSEQNNSEGSTGNTGEGEPSNSTGTGNGSGNNPTNPTETPSNESDNGTEPSGGGNGNNGSSTDKPPAADDGNSSSAESGTGSTASTPQASTVDQALSKPVVSANTYH